MKRTSLILMVLQVPLDFLMLILASLSAYQLRFSDWAVNLRPILFDLSLTQFLYIAAVVALVWIVVFALLGLYSPDPNKRFTNEIARVFFGCSIGLSLVALYILFTLQMFESRFLIAAGWFFSIFYVSFGRLLMRGIRGVLHRLNIGLKRVLIIGEDDIANNVADTLKERVELGYEVIGKYDHFGKKEKQKFSKREEKPDEIIFASPRSHEKKEVLSTLEWCNENHVVFKYSADLFATFATNMAVNPLAGVPVVEIKRTKLEGWGRVIKRAFDVIVSIILIIFASPIMLLVALAILIETGRPIIYKNKRVGVRGKNFFTFKFRSMYQEDSIGPQFENSKEAKKREEDLIEEQNSREGPIYKIKDDPRVTPLGGFLRRWSIDELPQFFNVLGGTMSLVGPRPHQPREVEEYDSQYKRVLSIKPGVTGLAQISGRSDLSFKEEMRLDIFYIENWNLVLDLVILAKTPFIVFKKRKAL